MSVSEKLLLLLPCPLCGSARVRIELHPTYAATLEQHIVCGDCRLRLPAWHEEGPRVEIWNARAADDERNRLRAALRELHAIVRGEFPSLLNEDSGGDAKLACEIEDLLDDNEDMQLCPHRRWMGRGGGDDGRPNPPGMMGDQTHQSRAADDERTRLRAIVEAVPISAMVKREVAGRKIRNWEEADALLRAALTADDGQGEYRMCAEEHDAMKAALKASVEVRTRPASPTPDERNRQQSVEIELLNDLFDFLGGVDGAADLRERILVELRHDAIQQEIEAHLAADDGEGRK